MLRKIKQIGPLRNIKQNGKNSRRELEEGVRRNKWGREMALGESD